jgi:DNA-binding GntR family transcriptional regulator
MYVALVSHVPNDVILGGIKHAVQRYAELDHTEVRCKVSAVLADALDQKLSDLSVQAKYCLLVKRP